MIWNPRVHLMSKCRVPNRGYANTAVAERERQRWISVDGLPFSMLCTRTGENVTYVLAGRGVGRVDSCGDHSASGNNLACQIPFCLQDHVSGQFSNRYHVWCFLKLDALRVDKFTLVVDNDPRVQSAMILPVDIGTDCGRGKLSAIGRNVLLTSHNAAAVPCSRFPYRQLVLSFLNFGSPCIE